MAITFAPYSELHFGLHFPKTTKKMTL